MFGKLIVGFIVIVLGVVVGWYALEGKNLQMPNLTGSTQNSKSTGASGVSEEGYNFTEEQITGQPVTPGAEKGGVITVTPVPVVSNKSVSYGDDGFSPLVITVKVGTQVKFSNNSIHEMRLKASPASKLTGFDQAKSVLKGGEYNYTFSQVGTYKYYNNSLPQHAGTVIVIQ